jgi:hypothetical protein
MHVAVEHEPEAQLTEQTLLEQSLPVEHLLPMPQLGQAPPQSMSVSFPFMIVSLHVGAIQTELLQTPLTQSVLLRHW